MKFVMKDSFESIFRDLKRVGQDASEVMREELGKAITQIINETPVETGMSAASWIPAAQALDADIPSITPHVDERKTARGQVRRKSLGPRLGYYVESRGGLFGLGEKNNFTFEAGTRDTVAIANEYGFNGMEARHPVKYAVKKMKERIGPEFEKAIKARMQKPRHMKTTTV
jgi:hypothetical protein